MASDITLHVELMGQDRELLERMCKNIEWFRKNLQEQKQEQAQMTQVEQEEQEKRKGEAKEHVV